MGDPEIPVFDLRIEDEDLDAVAAVLRSGWLSMGPQTEAFEREFAAHLGCRHVVALSNCTAALHLACLAAGVGPGDEVIVPPITFVATANAPRYAGARPVFADVVGEGDLGISVERVAEAVSPRTKAVLPVHFAGYPVDIEGLRKFCDEHGLALIEDAAHAPDAAVSGRNLGTFGDAGCFSFFSNKVLAAGEGGALATDSDEIANRVRSLRSHAMTSVTWDRHRGHAETYDVVDLGFNYRIDEPRAALLRSRLTRLSEETGRRREIVRRYRELLDEVHGVETAYRDRELDTSSPYLMCVLLEDAQRRPELRARLLEEDGVQTTVFPAVHTLSAYAELTGDTRLPVAEAVAAGHLVLPLHAHMDAADVERVVAAVARILR